MGSDSCGGNVDSMGMVVVVVVILVVVMEVV